MRAFGESATSDGLTSGSGEAMSGSPRPASNALTVADHGYWLELSPDTGFPERESVLILERAADHRIGIMQIVRIETPYQIAASLR